MIVRELLAVLGFDVQEADLKKAEDSLEGLKKIALGISAAFAGIGAALLGTVKELADAGDEARDASRRLGTTVEAIQELRVAAQLSGLQVGAFDNALEQLGRRAADAAAGNKEQAAAFTGLGISVRDAGGRLRPTDELLGDVADKLQAMPDAGKRSAAAFQLFGRGGGPMLQMLAEGSAGLAKMRAEAIATGAIISGETADAADALNDDVFSLKLNVIGISRAIGAQLMPVVHGVVAETLEWFRANREVIKQRLHQAIDLMVRGFRTLWTVGRGVFQTFRQLLDIFGGLRTLAIGVGLAMGGVLAYNVGAALIAVNKLVMGLRVLTLAQLQAVAIPVLLGAAFLAFAAIVGLIIEDILVYEEHGDNAITVTRKLRELLVDKAFSSNPLIAGLQLIAKSASLAHTAVKELTEALSNLVTLVSPDAEPLAKREADRGLAKGARRLKTVPGAGFVRGVVDRLGIGGDLSVNPPVLSTSVPSSVSGRYAPSVSFGPTTVTITAPPGTEPEGFKSYVEDAMSRMEDERMRRLAEALPPPEK
jgi:hypothetical protein